MTITSKTPHVLPSFLAFVLVGAGLVTESWAETWTNLRGTSSIEAEMVGLWGDRLILDTGDGRRIAVSLDDLRAESRIQALQLAASIDQAREARIGELKIRSTSAAAPAPHPLPQPPPVNAYATPDKTQDVAAQFAAIDEQLRAGHLLVIFDALPDSYQKEIDALSKIAATKVNATTWKSLIGSVHQLGDVIVTKQNWFFSHPRFDVDKSPTPDLTKELNETILSIANIFRSGIDTESFEPAKIQNMPLRDWFAERDNLIAPHLAAIFRQSNVSPPKFSIEKSKGKEVSMQIETVSTESNEPATRSITMTKVDETFVPKAIADLWKTLIPQTQKTLESAIDDSLLGDPSTVVLLSAIEPLIRPLQEAQNRDDYHAAMQPLIEFVMPMLPELQKRFGSGS